MNYFLTLTDKFPIIMATATVIAATLVMSILVVVVRWLEPAPKAVIVALIMAVSAWAIVFQSL